MSHDPLSELAEPPLQPAADEKVTTASAAVAEAGVEPVPGQGAVEAAAESVVELPDTLTITDVGTLHKTFLGLLDDGTAPVLDGEAVEMVDGAGLQLLTAVFKEAAARQLPVRWHAASDTLRRGAAELGVHLLLDLGDDGAA
jgi:anti-anti-sigma regulatory factor